LQSVLQCVAVAESDSSDTLMSTARICVCCGVCCSVCCSALQCVLQYVMQLQTHTVLIL